MLTDLSIPELAKGLRDKKFSCVDIVNDIYSNIDGFKEKTNAFVSLRSKEEAIAIAKDKDAHIEKASSLLYGLPFVLKDSYLTKDLPTTAASTILDGFMSPYNATVYQKLLNAGAILIGKMNMDAWGHGATSENSDFGAVCNPWDVTRVAGGSTGGCAAAIASGMAIFAIGEDTGGSIRNPSAWCNTTGLKVTYGRVSRYGCISYASSFDTVGPMAKSAIDCACVLEVIAGKDPYDGTSSPHPVDQYSTVDVSIQGKRIGVPKEFFGEGLDSEIKTHIKHSLDEFKKLGATIVEISLPAIQYGIPVYYLIAPSETSSNLARYDGVRFGTGRENFTDEAKRRIMMGTFALSTGYYDAYYRKAQKARTVFIKEYQKAFEACDVMITPVTPYAAPKLGALIDDPLQNMLADVYTTLQNPVGVPSLAIPCGFTSENLPIGLQITGPMFSEKLLFDFACAYQGQTDWHTRKPTL